MKFTQVLFRQHIDRAFRRIWQTQRVRPVFVTKAEEVLASLNISVKDATEVVKPEKKYEKIELSHWEKKIVFDETHPDWKERPCLTYKDHNVLQEGLSQAYLLTKTIKVEDKLPEKIQAEITDIPEHTDELIQRIIRNCTIFDAHQELLPKLKDPNRPAWVFPRQYGITSTRRMQSISKKFLQLCEMLSTMEVVQNRFIVHNGVISTTVEKESDLLQFTLNMDVMLTSLVPIPKIADGDMGRDTKIADMYPLHHTIGLDTTNIYKTENIYPITTTSPWMNIHTIFVNHDAEKVKNITELPVSEDQILARSLLETFTAATSCAQAKFGADVKLLPEPITVQCVQSDGQIYHFSVFQLNTLDINGTEGVKNFWWSEPRMKLYEKAQYENGRPTFEGYNAEVFKRIYAFYKNR